MVNYNKPICLYFNDSIEGCKKQYFSRWFADNRTPLYLYNVLLWFISCLATVLSLFTLIVEASVYLGIALEVITLSLSFAGAVCGVITLLTSSILYFALKRSNVSLLHACKTVFAFSTIVEVAVFMFGVWTVGVRYTSLSRDIVDWDVFIRYYQEPYIRDDLDAIQRGLKCCGFESYKDWDLNPYYSCNSSGYSRCSVPFSCCKRQHIDSECVLGIRDPSNTDRQLSEFIYMEGCLQTTKDWYKYTVILISYLSIYQAVLKWLLIVLIESFNSEPNDSEQPVNCKVKAKHIDGQIFCQAVIGGFPLTIRIALRSDTINRLHK